MNVATNDYLKHAETSLVHLSKLAEFKLEPTTTTTRTPATKSSKRHGDDSGRIVFREQHCRNDFENKRRVWVG